MEKFIFVFMALAIAACVYFDLGCADEQAERKLWRDCGVAHVECAGDRACEYEYYKECINAEPTP